MLIPLSQNSSLSFRWENTNVKLAIHVFIRTKGCISLVKLNERNESVVCHCTLYLKEKPVYKSRIAVLTQPSTANNISSLPPPQILNIPQSSIVIAKMVNITKHNITSCDTYNHKTLRKPKPNSLLLQNKCINFVHYSCIHFNFIVLYCNVQFVYFISLS